MLNGEEGDILILQMKTTSICGAQRKGLYCSEGLLGEGEKPHRQVYLHAERGRGGSMRTVSSMDQITNIPTLNVGFFKITTCKGTWRQDREGGSGVGR
jgi:hypothetical protein